MAGCEEGHQVCEMGSRGPLVLFFLWACGLLVAIILVPLFGTRAAAGSACKPDGSFSVLDDYDAWNTHGFFFKSLRRHLQSSPLPKRWKLIDVVWDVVSRLPRFLGTEKPKDLGHK